MLSCLILSCKLTSKSTNLNPPRFNVSWGESESSEVALNTLGKMNMVSWRLKMGISWKFLAKSEAFLMKVYEGLVWWKLFFSTEDFWGKKIWFASWNLSEYSQLEDSKSSDISSFTMTILREITEVEFRQDRQVKIWDKRRFRTLFDEGCLANPKRGSSKSEKELAFVVPTFSDATHQWCQGKPWHNFGFFHLPSFT